MLVGRAYAAASALPNGQVLIAGGYTPGEYLQSAELFNPATKTFTALPASGDTELQTGRMDVFASPLPGGQVLIGGGREQTEAILTARKSSTPPRARSPPCPPRASPSFRARAKAPSRRRCPAATC